MAIEDFANSLLSRQEEKNEKLYQRLKRDERKDMKDYFIDSMKYRLAAKAVDGVVDTALNIGNDMVRDRTAEFLNSEESLAKRSLVSSSLNNIETINNKQEAIDKFKGGRSAYFLNEATNDLAISFDDFAIKQGNKYNKTQLDNFKAILIQQRAKQLSDAFTKAKNGIVDLSNRGIKNIEAYDKLIAENSPQSISGFFADKVQKTFTGKDPLKNFFNKNKNIFDTAEKNEAFFEVYEKLTDDLITAEDIANAKLKIERATGEKFEFDKNPSVTYGTDKNSIIEVEVTETNDIGVSEIKKKKITPKYNNGVLIGYVDVENLLEVDGTIVNKNVPDQKTLQLNFQNPDYNNRLSEIAGKISFPPDKFKIVNSYLKVRTGRGLNVFAEIADTGKVEDMADMVILNDFYGNMAITQTGLMRNYGFSYDDAMELTSNIHFHNINLQKDSDEIKDGIKFLDEEFADDVTEIDILKSSLDSNFVDGGQKGGWNSIIATIAVNDEFIRNGNTGFGSQFRGEQALLDLVDDFAGMDDVNFMRDVKTMPFTAIAETLNYINSLKELYDSNKNTNVGLPFNKINTFNNLKILKRIEKVLVKEYENLKKGSASF